jgi:RNA polymerase sigma factor (sigma-70 family)
MVDEQNVVEGCRNKDRFSQRKLYERFAGKMLAVAQRYTHSRFDAEDVLQEAFIKIFNQIHTFRFECPLEQWVKRVVVNTAISFLRKEKVWQHQAELENHAESVSVPESAPSGMQYEQLLEVVRELPSGCQTIFNLFAIEGYPHQEIANLLGISEGTSKSQYARAKQLLQAKLMKEENR